MSLYLKVLIVFIASLFVMTFSYAGIVPTTQQAATQQTIQKKEVPGLGTVYEIATMSGSIYIAGQPSEEGLKQLKKWKVKTIINLQPKKVAADDAATAEKLGIHYVDIPVSVRNFKLNTIKQFNQAINSSSNYPVYIYSKTANLAAMMIVFNNITQHDMPMKVAIDEAKNYGLTDHSLERFIKKTVRHNFLDE